MKRILIILGFVGWLALPVLCHVAYRDVKEYMGMKCMVLDKACSSLDSKTASQIWTEYKGLGSVTETWRTRYFPPFAAVWLLLGVGLTVGVMNGKK